MSNKALGRGLSALMGNITIENIMNSKERSEYTMMPVHVLHASPLQPRQFFDKESLQRLSESIKANGILQPVIVRKSTDNSFEIIAGERRWRAAMLAEMEQIPVIIKDLDDRAVLTIAILENVQRQDLNIVEEAEGYKKLIDEFSYTQEDLSTILGKSRSHISNILRLLSLPESIIKMLKENLLSFGHARTLINIENAEEIAQQIINRSLSVRQTEQLIKKLGKGKGNTQIKNKANGTQNIQELEQLVQDSINMRVNINKECIKIYYDNDINKLDYLLSLITEEKEKI